MKRKLILKLMLIFFFLFFKFESIGNILYIVIVMQFHISQLEICKNYLKILHNTRKINCSFNIALVIVTGNI